MTVRCFRMSRVDSAMNLLTCQFDFAAWVDVQFDENRVVRFFK